MIAPARAVTTCDGGDRKADAGPWATREEVQSQSGEPPMYDIALWFGYALRWLTSPSVIPATGAVAAIAAALTIAPKSWFQSWGTSLGRVLRVAVVWFLVAWLMRTTLGVFGWSEGSGYGADGAGHARGGAPNTADRSDTGLAVGNASFTANLPAQVVCAIGFVAQSHDPAVAENLRCTLLVRHGQGWKSQDIRGDDMPGFEQALAAALRAMAVDPSLTGPRAVIVSRPYPGEGTLRRVERVLRGVLPQVAVRIEEGV